MPVLYLDPVFDFKVPTGRKTQTRRDDMAERKITESTTNVETGRDVHVTQMMLGKADARYIVRYTSMVTEKYGDITMEDMKAEGDPSSKTS